MTNKDDAIPVSKLNSGEDAAQQPEMHTEKPARAARPRRNLQSKNPESVAAAMPQRKCHIGHEVTGAAKFCPECGAKIIDPAAPLTCGNGHEVSLQDKFCAECGDLVSPEPGYSAVAVRPRPESELSADELVARKRAHDAALRMGKEAPDVMYQPGQAPASVKTTIIHFLNDGFGAFGVVWLRGQEIELWPGHPRWREAQAWITLDVAGQFKRWGRQMFGIGPWPGEQSYTAGAGHFQQMKALSGDGSIAQPTEEELARGDAAEQRRGRRVPAPIG